MTSAAIYYQADAYDTKRLLMGRQMAGIGFVRAMARYGEARELFCYARTKGQFAEFQAQVARLVDKPRPCVWIRYPDLAGLAKVGTLYYPSPHYPWLAWQRRFLGPRAYSLCGVTHTVCTASVMDALGDYLLAPIESWDALICTSRAGKAAIEKVLANWGEYLARRMGGKAPRAAVQTPIIPLGTDTEAFGPRKDDAKTRAALRQRMGIARGDVAVLFVGRLSYHEKAHPMPMYLALEEAAKRTGKRIHLIQAGKFPNDAIGKQFAEGAELFCPSVRPVFVPGDDPALGHDLWRAADIFTSFSDNIQETFGLTPVEAMAAGLPVVVSDWDGYRDTVRHGVDGFRVPTIAPQPGVGDELAFRSFLQIDSYERYVGNVSQCVAVDVGAAADAFAALIDDAGLRRRMGEAGRARAAAHYDWRVIAAAYHELWRELGERRRKDAEVAPRRPGTPFHPLRDDPFSVFSGYPSVLLAPECVVALREGADEAALARLCSTQMNAFALGLLAPAAEMKALLRRIGAEGPITVAALLGEGSMRARIVFQRTLCWFAKMGLVTIRTPPAGGR